MTAPLSLAAQFNLDGNKSIALPRAPNRCACRHDTGAKPSQGFERFMALRRRHSTGAVEEEIFGTRDA